MREAASDLIAKLAIPHHARGAFQTLLALGPAAIPAVRGGLGHASADVRYWCCRFLDHFVAEETMDELFGLARDPAPEVRAASLHALVCDRCKAGSCRPDAARTLEVALERLRLDDDPHVRAFAVEAVGGMTLTHREALEAILRAVASDPSPAVRKRLAGTRRAVRSSSVDGASPEGSGSRPEAASAHRGLP